MIKDERVEEYFKMIGFKDDKIKKEFFSKYISKTYRITDEDIISIFNKSKWKENKFNNLQLSQVIYIKEELVRLFLTNNNNLSIKLAHKWVCSNKIDFEIFITKLKYLEMNLSTRKKCSKSFLNFVDKLEKSNQKTPKKDNRLKVKKGKAKDLMHALNQIKKECLIGSDKELIKLIYKNLKTEHTYKTLKSYYFTS